MMAHSTPGLVSRLLDRTRCMLLLESRAVKGYWHTFSRAALETNCSVIFTLFMQMVSVKSSVTCSACALVSPTFSKRLICDKSQHVISRTLLDTLENTQRAKSVDGFDGTLRYNQ